MKHFRKNWDNPISQERLELVFNNRNHDYGAYVIRRDYNQAVLKAFFATALLLMTILSLPAIINYFQPVKKLIIEPPVEGKFDLTDVVLPEKIIPPVNKIEALFKKPSGPTQQFTNLIVTDKDSLENMLTQEELLKTALATKTNKSDSATIKEELPDPEPTNNGGTNKVHSWVEEMPNFPGGEAAMLKYLSTNIHYPAIAREENITGIVYISFVVDRNGEIDNIQMVKGIGGGCEEEAIRVIKKMPQWKPGKQNGRAVNVQYMLPVAFRIK
ncbi:MAG: energy transducer TonB [Bacteroidetes bacterium]|jgi:protein TonB|nr:energy transducer TonB [Bacteroidota bacterium]MBK9402294.1 energy transducer TonB [Bacteroidota bacterium]MBL0095041.1 energy transducer TonB [Bacteroidota bacterium]